MKKSKEERRAARAAKKQKAADRQQHGSSGALSTQVAGDHYKGDKIQHVEFCQENRLPWCESAAIKYIVRHRKKNGWVDVQKAIHYLELLIAIDYGRREDGEDLTDMDPEYFKIPVNAYIKENEIPQLEAEAIRCIVFHHKGGDISLLNCIKSLKTLEATYQVDPMDLL